MPAIPVAVLAQSYTLRPRANLRIVGLSDLVSLRRTMAVRLSAYAPATSSGPVCGRCVTPVTAMDTVAKAQDYSWLNFGAADGWLG